MRYDRFISDHVYSYDKEKKALQGFITKETGIDFSNDSMMLVTAVDDNIKKLLGNTIGKISKEIYSLIQTESRRLNIYTYEIRHNSKAYKVFIREEYNFIQENRLWKEILIFTLNNKEKGGIIDLLKSQKSVAFENDSINNYLQSFHSPLKQLEHLDELEYFYEEELNETEKKDRFEFLDIIANSSVYIESEEK